MLPTVISTFATISSLGFGMLIIPTPQMPKQTVLSEHTISLDNRQPDRFVNGVFKDNILLTIAYMQGRVNSKSDIDWDLLRRPYVSEFRLQKGETFAFHDDVLPQYKSSLVKTTNSHFGADQGFKSDGYLMGDGVCHLATIMNWAARDAGLEVNAPTNHDFAKVNETPKEMGVAIYSQAGTDITSQKQNLYITNNRENPITFRLAFDGDKLTATVVEEN